MSLPESAIDNVYDTIKEHLPPEKFSQVVDILYGGEVKELPIDTRSKQIGLENQFDIKYYDFPAQEEQLRKPNEVVVAVVQNSVVKPTTDPITVQRSSLHEKITKIVEAAALNNVNVICFQETWHMPFAFCTREKLPWTEFAEDAETGPTTTLCCDLARKYNMVVINPILERDITHGEVIWNTAVVISEKGTVIGKSRKNHIPRVGDFNESTYYMESRLGHPVFETKFGKIAINICYGRHHPLNWLMYGLNGAEIVFNPNATVNGLSESIWPVEARCAAVANSYYVFATNRVGSETFPNEYTSGDGKPAHTTFGHFYGSAYVTAPSGLRTPDMSRRNDGLLITKIDLNLCRQVKDNWGFRLTQRLDLYGKSIAEAAKNDYEPQIIKG